ncbi:MAG TPA: hypothetical protein VMU00_10070 [Steroidobacteraceae bacterium]|nr:hypothetical protein [Steroidobacteraceae bacterium]
MSVAAAAGAGVLVLADGFTAPVRALLARYGLTLASVADGAPIPFSYWGEPEAGLEGSRVWVRGDTPLHSVLHEAGHALCMDGARRAALARDAGGDFEEENAVCCLQILLADELAGAGGARLMDDMDRWGYTFRLGSARRWFEAEADAARAWLAREGLLDGRGRLSWRRRA